MMLKEKSVWGAFKKVWPWYCERIEAWIAFGFPDVVLLGPEALIGMIELKAPARLHLRETQVLWHRRWQKHGGRSLVLTLHSRGEWWWWTGEDVFNMNKENCEVGGNEAMVNGIRRTLWNRLPENSYGPSTRVPSGRSFAGTLRRKHGGGVADAETQDPD